MRKEIIFALIIGLTIGLIVTYGVYTANKAISQRQKGVTANSTLLPNPTASAEPLMSLSISNPQDGIVTSEATTKIEGVTLPEAVVTILTEDNQYIVEADENGVFQQEVDLVKGANTLEISATDLNTITQQKTIQIVYSTEVDSDQ